MAEEIRSNWLDDIFPQAKKQREAQQASAFVFAQKYLVFKGPTSDPRARDLFEHWKKFVRRMRLPGNATPEQLAAHNAVREWVEGIDSQIELAENALQPDWLKT